MEKRRLLTIVCYNNHKFSIEQPVIEWLDKKYLSYSELVCPICKVQIRKVICQNCKKCVLPFSPCQNCGKDPLISEGPC